MAQSSFNLTVASSGQGAGDAPLLLGAERGMFDQFDLNVEVVHLPGGLLRIAESVQKGDTHFCTTPANTIVAINAKGGDLVALASIAGQNIHAIITPPEITKPEHLKGRVIGLVGFGGQDHLCFRIALKEWGLDPDTDVSLEERGERMDLWNALNAREIAALCSTPPLTFQAKVAGFNLLRDFGEEKTPYQLGVTTTRRAFIDQNREIVARYIAGLVESMRTFRQDPDLGKEYIRKMSHITDETVLDQTYALYHDSFGERPYPQVEAMTAVVEAVRDIGDDVQGIQAEDLIDSSFLEELEGSRLPI